MAQINQRELEAHTKALHKAFAGSEPPATILDIIKTLRNLGEPSEEMLRQTKAGVIVGKMRSNPNKDIARAATELVQKWRKAVENEKKGRSKPAGATSPTAPTPSNATPSPLPSRAKGQPFRGNPEKRSFKEDGVDINRTSSKVRNGCIGLLYNGLAFRSTENENDILVKAQAVEAASFKKHGGESTGYKEQMRSLMLNLKNKSNRELGLNVMSGRISPERLVNMTGDELKSEERKKEDEKFMIDNIKNAQVAQEAKSVSAELMCGKCGERKVSYTQAQTRSADEPMTTFCECLNCGKRWKFS